MGAPPTVRSENKTVAVDRWCAARNLLLGWNYLNVNECELLIIIIVCSVHIL